MMEGFIKKIEEQPISISQWIVGFVGIIFVRYFFEVLSSPTPSGIIQSDAYALVHIGLFFLTIILLIICVAGYFTKNYTNVSKIILFLLPIVWFAPIFDIIFSRGKGYIMSYIYDTHGALVLDFFKFFDPQIMHGATYGMRIAYTILLLAVGFYIWLKRKKILPVILTLLTLYVFMFIVGTIPSLLYTFTHLNTPNSTPSSVLYYVNDLVTKSNIYHNTLHETAQSVPLIRFLQIGFDKLMSQILFILSFILATIFFWKTSPQKFKAVIKNTRPERIFYYMSSFILTVGFAYITEREGVFSWVDVLGMICLLISWLGVWMYSVHVNDIADVQIDEISNSNRPIIQKTITSEEMHQIGYIYLALALLGSWSAGFYPFFMALVGLAVSYIYSASPLRLKRIPILTTFLISIVCLAAALAGFFFVSIDKQIHSFPILVAMGILTPKECTLCQQFSRKTETGLWDFALP
ncbi:MAG: UbiA family prenyltransferase [Candidatus Zambryskibacteria bacterium]|nr:UbiA family prenyltransferase [Candidatus Zambryskibacteria bacterium]